MNTQQLNTTLIPAYGRDYASKAKLLADWNSDKDFVIADIMSPWDGKYANRPQFSKGDRIQFRYGKLMKTFVHTVS